MPRRILKCYTGTNLSFNAGDPMNPASWNATIGSNVYNKINWDSASILSQPTTSSVSTASNPAEKGASAGTVGQTKKKRDLIGVPKIESNLKDQADSSVYSELQTQQQKLTDKSSTDFSKKDIDSRNAEAAKNRKKYVDTSGADVSKGTDYSGIIQGAGQFAGQVGQAFYQNSDAAGFGANDTTHQIRDSISDMALQSGNPYLMAYGAIGKVTGGVTDALGGRASDYTQSQMKAIGLGDDGGLKAANWGQHILNSIPGMELLGNFNTKKLSNAEISADSEAVRGGYGGALAQMDAASELGGTGLSWMFGSAQDRIEKKIQEANRKNQLLTGISRAATLQKQNDLSQEINSQNQKKYFGSADIQLSKEGSKVPENGIETPSKEDEKLPGIDTNVIPEGALHAHKNHLEEQNEGLDKVTEKGIPIIATDEKGDYTQLAEIEKEEIIFRLKLTKKIEELMEDGSEKAMIRAGKILAREIMCNTDDNTDEFLDGDD